MNTIIYKLQTNGEYGFDNIKQDTPEAKGHDILVEIKAIAINPVDYKVKHKHASQGGDGIVLGWDAAGIVQSVGDDVSLFQVGDPVYYAGDVTRAGSYSEFQLVDERLVAKIPSTLNFEQSAALPLTSLTAWELVFDRIKLDPKAQSTVLITGAAGGVGSILVQLLKAKTKARVIATYGREASKQWLMDLGADITIKHSDNFQQQLQQQGIGSVDAIFSLTHTDTYIEQFVECIKPQGALAFLDEPQALELLAFKPKSVSIHNEFMFTRSMFQTDDMIEQHHILTKMAQLIDSGKIKSTVNEVFGEVTPENIQRAHDLVESGKSRGKIVLTRK